MMTSINDTKQWLPDPPSGPLDLYRKQASFCWRKMKFLVENEELVKYKYDIFKKLEEDPLFHRSPKSLSFDELRKINTIRAKRIFDHGFVNMKKVAENPFRLMAALSALGQYDASVMIKYFVPNNFFLASIIGLGSPEQQSWMRKVQNEEIFGCYALTEVAHGTDAKNMRTTATFDKTTQEFVLNTPDFEAAKFWVGSLGQSSSHATVFAQLYTPDGVCHGLHGFLTPLRDPKTMLPYPGVIVGDQGEKLGLNGIDNGFAIFNNYRIPKCNLLSKNGCVSESGQYITPFKDPRKRFGASLGALVAGRVAIVNLGTANTISSVSIALRYSAVRKQFGPRPDIELPIIEYQLQQWRLFPYLAAGFAMLILSEQSSYAMIEYNMLLAGETNREKVIDYSAELHSLMSAAKPLVSWTAQKCVQECREACGGHGYLACSGFGSLRNDNDANCTYEGDNNVLVQQSSNWLLSLWKKRSIPFSSPLKSVEFLYKTQPDVRVTSVEQLVHIENILSMYEWLICWLLSQVELKYEANIKLGQDQFTAKNNCQVFLARDLSIAYIEHYTILTCRRKLLEADDKIYSREKIVFEKLIVLFGVWSLERHLTCFYEGGYATGPQLSQAVKTVILDVCSLLKNDIVSLVDSVTPPDFILNSAIGKTDGQIYKNLQAVILSTPGVMERPSWWREMTKAHRSRL